MASEVEAASPDEFEAGILKLAREKWRCRTVEALVEAYEREEWPERRAELAVDILNQFPKDVDLRLLRGIAERWVMDVENWHDMRSLAAYLSLSNAMAEWSPARVMPYLLGRARRVARLEEMHGRSWATIKELTIEGCRNCAHWITEREPDDPWPAPTEIVYGTCLVT